MRKRISIFFITLSALLMLAVSVVPHHHHDGWIHFLGKDNPHHPCESNSSRANDNQGESNNTETCVVHGIFGLDRAQQHIKYTAPVTFKAEFFAFFAAVIPHYWQLAKTESLVKSGFWNFTFCYSSPFTPLFNGLRAPPAHFS